MDSLFSDPNSQKVAGSLFNGAVQLAQGGTLSQAAMAVLDKGASANGTPAEPSIVEAGVRSENMMDEKTKHGYYIMGLIVVVGLIALYGME